MRPHFEQRQMPVPMRFTERRSHLGHLCLRRIFSSIATTSFRILRPYLGPNLPADFTFFVLLLMPLSYASTLLFFSSENAGTPPLLFYCCCPLNAQNTPKTSTLRRSRRRCSQPTKDTHSHSQANRTYLKFRIKCKILRILIPRYERFAYLSAFLSL